MLEKSQAKPQTLKTVYDSKLFEVPENNNSYLKLSANPIRPGAELTFSGSGFKSKASYYIWLDKNSDGVYQLLEPSWDIKTDYAGYFERKAVIPSDIPDCKYQIYVVENENSPAIARDLLETKTNGYIKLIYDFIAPGSYVGITGSGFPLNDYLVCWLDINKDGVFQYNEPYKDVQTDYTGFFRVCYFKVPGNTPEGKYNICVYDGRFYQSAQTEINLDSSINVSDIDMNFKLLELGFASADNVYIQDKQTAYEFADTFLKDNLDEEDKNSLRLKLCQVIPFAPIKLISKTGEKLSSENKDNLKEFANKIKNIADTNDGKVYYRVNYEYSDSIGTYYDVQPWDGKTINRDSVHIFTVLTIHLPK